MAKKGGKAGLFKKFRRKPKETPSLAGYPKRKHVVISPVRRTEGKAYNFEADFSPPKKGSQLAPLKSHHVAYALELGCFQVANAALRKFEGRKGVSVVLTGHNVKWRRMPTSDKKPLLQIGLKEKTATGSGTELLVYRSRVVDKDNPKTVFGNGEFSVAVLKS